VSGAGTQESPFEIRETPPPSSVGSGTRVVLSDREFAAVDGEPEGEEEDAEDDAFRDSSPVGAVLPCCAGRLVEGGFYSGGAAESDRPDLARLRSPTPTPVPGPSRQPMEVVESLRAETWRRWRSGCHRTPRRSVSPLSRTSLRGR